MKGLWRRFRHEYWPEIIKDEPPWRFWSRQAIEALVFVGLLYLIGRIHPLHGEVQHYLALIAAGLLAQIAARRVLGKPAEPPYLDGVYSLRLISAGPRTMAVVKELRGSCAMSFQRAKGLVGQAPATFGVGSTLTEAELIAARLRTAGATVVVPGTTRSQWRQAG